MLRQKKIPGVLPKRIEKLETLAEDYEEIKNERCEMTRKEVTAKKAVEGYMIEEKIKEYSVNSTTTFVIEEGEKHLKIVKSKMKESDDEDEG